jgi:hypothetical protein
MKFIRIFIFLLLIINITGCKFISDIYYNCYYGILIEGKKLYYDKRFSEIEKNFESIANWIKENIEYTIETKTSDTFKNPERAIKEGYGDCDTYTILFMNIAYFVMDIKVDCVLVNPSERIIIDGGLTNHAEIWYNGYCYDIYSGYRYPLGVSVGFLYYFEWVFGR